MYTLTSTKRFTKSLRKLQRSGKLTQSVRESVEACGDYLVNGKKLPKKFQDNQLTGDMQQYRECHLRGDLLVVYSIDKKEGVVILNDIGSHAQIFG